MKEKKNALIVLLTVSAIAVNVAGRIFTKKMGLPVLFDSFGTVLVAYLLGPVSGAAVGLCGNVAYGLLVNPVSAGYGITSMVLGILVGISARKGRFESFFGTLTVSFIVTIASVAVSTPLNFDILQRHDRERLRRRSCELHA